MQADLLYTCKNETGEAVMWLPQRRSVAWVDIENKTLHMLNPLTGVAKEFLFPKMITTLVPWNNGDEIVIAREDKLLLFNPDTELSRDLLDLPDIRPGFRTNDGKASPDGRLWLGVMHLSNHRHTGALYQIDADGNMVKVLNNQSIPNGIVWNNIGDTMYYADSGEGCIFAFDYEQETGRLSNKRIAVKVPARYGVPDGMTIDADNNLWVAHWGGFGVYVWNPDNGELLDKVEVPVPQVASCTFGGEKGNQLFITTARAGLSAQELEHYPLSGSLFEAETDVCPGENHYSYYLKQ